MCTDVLMNDYVGRGKETFTYMYKECKHYTTGTSSGRTILLFFHICSECIPTEAPPLQGRKLVNG